MKILVLGGTIFVGRHLVQAALAQGHEVTLFNRGQQNTSLFPEAEKLEGDRGGNLKALRGRSWDAVLDTCGYIPRLVSASARLLADAAEHYTFISTLDVYQSFSQPGQDESAPLGRTTENQQTEAVTEETYGPLKVLCEEAAEAAMPGRVLVVRPGVVVGPYDPTDRFTYWVHRMAQGGNVLVPDRLSQRIQFIDARDLAEWTIRMIEARRTGSYNVVTTDASLTLGLLLEQGRAAAENETRLIQVAEPFLLDHKVASWPDLPLWLPQQMSEKYGGGNTFSAAKAVADGLTFRPLAEIVHDTLVWDQDRPADYQFQAGLKPERERELLAAWQEQAQSDSSALEV